MTTPALPGPLRRYGPGHRRAVVCFHHAGGGMSAYRAWPDLFSAGADVVLVQLKGREDRIAEPLGDDLGDLALQLARGLGEMPYDDVVLVGHSMGATVAWAVADAMWAVFRRRAAVVVSAQVPTPYAGRTWKPPAGRSADGPAADLHAAVLAADLAWMAREFPSAPARPLPVDLWSLSADQDDLATPGEMAGWAALTTGRYTAVTVPGGHMYLLDDPAPLVEIVTERALRLVSGGGMH